MEGQNTAIQQVKRNVPPAQRIRSVVLARPGPIIEIAGACEVCINLQIFQNFMLICTKFAHLIVDAFEVFINQERKEGRMSRSHALRALKGQPVMEASLDPLRRRGIGRRMMIQ